MAAVTALVTTADTTTSPNVSGAFTPAENDLLIVFLHAANTVQDPGTISNSQGITFTQFKKAAYPGARLYGFVADSLVTAGQAVSQTITADFVSDDFGGTIIGVAGVSGMTASGLSAIKQSINLDAGVAAATPAATFAAAALTGNPTLVAVGNDSNPAALTPPTNWNEAGDTGFNTPTTGMEWGFRDSGFTGTTVTWGSTSATQYCVMIVELDSTALDPIRMIWRM
jgi:hypothetical protein